MSTHGGSTSRRGLSALVAVLVSAAALGGLLPATARADSAPLNPADPATPRTVTADPLPTVQINGVAWSQVIVGDRVYVAGEFTSARPAGAPPGTGETPRSHLLAYDLLSGELVASFAPRLNAQAVVVTASPDGRRIYVGGDFTQVDGQVRNRVAAFDTATGALVPDFRPSVSGRLRALAATNTTVYLGGMITAVGSVSRSRLAAVSASNGALLPWAPVPGTGPTDGNRHPDPTLNSRTSDEVMSLVLTGNGSQVVAAGRFHTMNGVRATGVAALDPVSGQNRAFAVNQVLTNQGAHSAIYHLSTDGTTVYGSAYDYHGPGNLEGVFAAEAVGGKLAWVADCRGDTYATAASGNAVYVASHEHNCENIGSFLESTPLSFEFSTALSRAATGRTGPFTKANGAFAYKPAPAMLPWFPDMVAGSYTGSYQAGWSVTANDRYVVYGGEFPRVNGTRQQGLVRFALSGVAPGRVGPAPLEAPSAVALGPGTVRVAWRAGTDPDNGTLTYRVLRDGTPVHQVTRPSTWYDTPLYAFTDTAVPAGTHTYQVTATDPLGNRVASSPVAVGVTAGSVPGRSYAATVLADDPASYWPLGERSGGTALDRAGGNDLTVHAGVTRGVAGAVPGDPDTAFAFNGSTSGYAVAADRAMAPNTFTVEAWFQTTSTAGGRIIGLSSATTGTSTGSYDRHVYMDGAGRLTFGVYPAEGRVVTGPASYNDGRWHHVVATMGLQGMALYVDGALVGSRGDTHMGQPFSGYWRIGGDSTWAGAPFLNGRIDEVAVYRSVLSATQVRNHHAVGSTGRAGNLAPTASFLSTVTGSTASLDASPSTDADGTITGYAWDFGDGTTGTGRTVSHTYRTPGTYTVTLRVTDNGGATGSRSNPVTASAPPANAAPEARFTATSSLRTASLDASASRDVDGTITSYAWDFGDGTTGTGRTASHTYAADGPVTVRLTVTDDRGATGTSSQTMTISSTAVAADGFGREVASGWGAADVGGAWTVGGGGSTAVTGGAGQLTGGAGRSVSALLGGVSAQDVGLQADVVVPAATTGGGTYLSLATQRVGTSDYRTKLWFRPTGELQVLLARTVDGAETTLRGATVPGGWTPGSGLRVRFEAAGSGTATLRAKVWAAGAAEPAEWTVSAGDATASVQRPGAVLVFSYVSGSATAPSTVRLDDLWVGPAGTAPPRR